MFHFCISEDKRNSAATAAYLLLAVLHVICTSRFFSACLAVHVLQCFDTDGGRQEEHLACKN